MQHKYKKLSAYGLVSLMAFSSFGGQGFANTTSSSPASLHLDENARALAELSVIVELDEESILQAKHKGKSQSEQFLSKERDRILKQLEKKGASVELLQEYDTVFSGFSLEIDSSDL